MNAQDRYSLCPNCGQTIGRDDELCGMCGLPTSVHPAETDRRPDSPKSRIPDGNEDEMEDHSGQSA